MLNDTDTTTNTTDPIDRIFTMVDTTKSASDVEIPAGIRADGEAVARTAYFGARAAGKSIEAAKALAASAFTAHVTVAMKPAAGPEIDQAGRVRSQRDVDTLTAAGFKMAAPVYERGTTVVDVGVDNARAARADFEAMPLMSAALSKYEATIAAEKRTDMVGSLGYLKMTDDGKIVRASSKESGLALTPRSLSQLCSRLDCDRGGPYLASCPADLRAVNVNHWLGKKRDNGKDEQVKLRVRRATLTKGASHEVFAAVTESYTAFDGDKVAEAMRRALDGIEARGTTRYDGERSSFDAFIHTTVQPERFVAGEVFRVGISLTTSDVGGGSIVVRSVAYQNLCRNLIIIDVAALPIATIRHVGNGDALARKFRDALTKAKNSIAPFMVAWNAACQEKLAIVDGSEKKTIAGVFAGLIDDGFRLPGYQVKETIDRLVRAWEADESSATIGGRVSRAAVVNAITRAAHELTFDDPWAVDSLQESASRLLWNRPGGSKPSLAWIDPAAVIDRARTSDEATRQGARVR